MRKAWLLPLKTQVPMLTTEEQETLETYNDIAESWNSTLTEEFWLPEYKKFKAYLPQGKIIDLGCGSGWDSRWFSQNGYEVTGIDISPAMIGLARAANPKATFLVKSFYDLNFPPESFDGFWCACSLIHVPRAKIGRVLRQIKQLLKKGAVGFVAVKEGQGERMAHWQKSGKKRYFVYYSQEEFSRLLNEAGLEILEMQKNPPTNLDRDGPFLVYYLKA